MTRIPLMAVAVAALAISGCSMKVAQNAQEYRAEVGEHNFGTVERFTVQRPLASVVKTFRSKAPECLKLVIRIEKQKKARNRRGRRDGTFTTRKKVTYHPTVVGGRGRFELHLQRTTDDMYDQRTHPPGGRYILVLDAIRLDANSTAITMYRARGARLSLRTYVKAWAAGSGRGCPDLE